VAGLDLVHRLLDFGEPRHGLRGADGQREEHQPEPVAHLARQRLVERAQVERHERVDLFERLPAFAQMTVDRAGHGGDHDVVDGGVERVRRPLHPPQVDGVGPRDAVRALQRALDR